MKILVVCQYYRPEPFRIADICAALVEAGHEVTVVTGTPNYPEGEIYPGYEGAAHRDEVLDGVRVHRCPIHPRKRGSVHRFWNYYSFVFASRRYLAGLNEEFDVVFVNQLSPVMMAEGVLEELVADLEGGVVAGVEGVDALAVQVVADCRELCGKQAGEGQADVAQTNHANFYVFIHYLTDY